MVKNEINYWRNEGRKREQQGCGGRVKRKGEQGCGGESKKERRARMWWESERKLSENISEEGRDKKKRK